MAQMPVDDGIVTRRCKLLQSLVVQGNSSTIVIVSDPIASCGRRRKALIHRDRIRTHRDSIVISILYTLVSGKIYIPAAVLNSSNRKSNSGQLRRTQP